MGRTVLAFMWVLGAAGAGAGEAGAVFDVPKVETVAIDGKADDWADRGFRVEALVWLDGPPLPANDLDTRFRLGWDARGLLLLVQTADDVPLEEPDPPRLWTRDSVELFLAERKGGRQTEKVWGIGCTWMSTDVFGPRTFGHGSAASATIRIDPDNELVVTMTRNTAGRNFGTYHGRFLKLVADCLADAKRPAAGRG